MNVRSVAVAVMDRVPARVARRFGTRSAPARLLRPFVNWLVGDELTQVTVRAGYCAGLRIEIDPREEKYYWTGTFETEVQHSLVRLLGPGAVLWDVGAHAGFHTALASRRVGPTGQVAAFEPLPANVARLRRTIESNSLTNVIVRPLAVSDAPGSATFHVARSSTMGSLVAFPDEATSLEVESTTLDLELTGLRSPTVVKLDIEGGELAALRGAFELLTRRRPFLIVECLSPQRLDEVAAAIPWYRFRRLDETNHLAEPMEGRSTSMSPRRARRPP